MNVSDASAWLEYLADASNADFFAGAIEAADELPVPAISLEPTERRMPQDTNC